MKENPVSSVMSTPRFPKNRRAYLREMLLMALSVPMLVTLSFLLISLSFEVALAGLGYSLETSARAGFLLGCLAGALTLAVGARDVRNSRAAAVVLGERALEIPGECVSPVRYRQIQSVICKDSGLVLEMTYGGCCLLDARVWPAREIASALRERLYSDRRILR